MVKKLFKHEFVYYFRTFGLFLPIVLVIGAMVRVFRFFENSESTIANIAIFSSSSMFMVSCAALVLLSVVVAVVRFYKNMYTAEGYLTFTLPVSNAEHIFVKLVTALCCQAICILTVIVAGAIALLGEPLLDVLIGISKVTAELYEAMGAVNTVIFSIEMLIIAILSVSSTLLLFYACITVGQTAKKNRIIMAVGAYFLYYIATQVVSTVFVMIFTVLGMTGALDVIGEWIGNHPIASVHIGFVLAIAFYSALGSAFWFVSQRIMTKKLNLE